MKTERVGRDLYVVVHTTETPPDVEWDEYVGGVSDAKKPPIKGIFVVTDGGGPNAAQRQRLLSSLDQRSARPRVAILSPSVLVRSIVAALNLFAAQPMKMFSPSDVDGAMGYLGVTRAEREELIGAALRISRELGVDVRALEAAA